MSLIVENEQFLSALVSSKNSKSRLQMIRKASDSELLCLFEILYNYQVNSSVQQLVPNKNRRRTLLNKLKAFFNPKKGKEFSVPKLRKLILKFNFVLPALLSFVLNSLLSHFRET